MKKQRMNSMPRTLACIAIAITLAYSAIVSAASVDNGSGDAEQEPYQTYTHCVREGETIWSIAGQVCKNDQDIRHVMYQIQQDNGIGHNDDIKPGQQLIIRY